MNMRNTCFGVLLSAAALCVATPAVACEPPSKPELSYVVSVPDTVPAKITYDHKDGVLRTADGHAMYRGAHREGWNECLHRFVTGEIALEGRDAMPSMRAETLFVKEARSAGFRECLAALADLACEFGEPAVRAVMSDPYAVK